jgi:hypothetical protein
LVPSSALGLLLFVTVLAPGLAYVLRHERSVPAVAHSAFRESLRVLFASVVCLGVTALLFAILHWVAPMGSPDVNRLVQDPSAYVRANYVHVAWWSVGLIVFATLLGFLAADPRFVSRASRARASRAARALVGATPISPSSGLTIALTDMKEGEGETFVGAQMNDGSYVQGYLISYNSHNIEDGNRDIVITRAQMRTRAGTLHSIGSTFTVISARCIDRLDVTHLTRARDQQ